nr:FAD-binding protein [uncultured Shinella sp.]
MTSIAPTTIDALQDAIADAARSGTRLEIRAGGSKSAIGAPRDTAILDMRGFVGVVDYDPPELVLTVRAGTALADVEALVAGENQMLAFDPWDHGPIFGRPAGAATIGGVVAAGVAGSRRVTAGGARDHLLGFSAVSGRGEHFVAGAKVVKNVTGYDLPKLMAGSWGRLAAMTELTLKVLPRPRMSATLVAEGLSPPDAHAAMARALGSHAEVSAAAHLPAGVGSGPALTLFRLAGFEPSVEARCVVLPEILRDRCALVRLDPIAADRLWYSIRHAAPIADGALWKIHVPPSRACELIATLEPLGARWLFDWGGALIWLGYDGDPAIVRAAAEAANGEAMLVRAPDALRGVVPAQHPRAPGVAALERRVRRAFDPSGVFETGRFLQETYAD